MEPMLELLAARDDFVFNHFASECRLSSWWKRGVTWKPGALSWFDLDETFYELELAARWGQLAIDPPVRAGDHLRRRRTAGDPGDRAPLLQRRSRSPDQAVGARRLELRAAAGRISAITGRGSTLRRISCSLIWIAPAERFIVAGP